MIKYYVTNLLFFWFFVLKGDENMIKISVVGAGNGGQALAGYLAMKGFDVSLFNRSRRRIYPIIQTRSIKIEGSVVEGEYKISFATTKIDEAIKGRKLILIVVPAFAHKELAEKMVPFLEDGQIIVLNPGRTGGALEFYNVLKSKGLKKDVIIAEAQTFIFASRMSNPGVTRIFRIKMPCQFLPYQHLEILNWRKYCYRSCPNLILLKVSYILVLII